MKSPTRENRKRGFTLIEMIVATFLLAVAVVGALVAFSSATQSAAFSERLHTVSLLAQKQMTELELQADTITGGEQQGDFGQDFPEYRWRQVVEPTEYQDLYRVTLTVQWGATNAPRERAFVTYIRNTSNSTTGSSTSGGASNGAQTTP